MRLVRLLLTHAITYDADTIDLRDSDLEELMAEYMTGGCSCDLLAKNIQDPLEPSKVYNFSLDLETDAEGKISGVQFCLDLGRKLKKK